MSGRHWDVFKVPGASELDFRDVEAFGADVALVMGRWPGRRLARLPHRRRRAQLDAGVRNSDAEGFFDCMDFDGRERAPAR
jgi:hypothetical protein